MDDNRTQEIDLATLYLVIIVPAEFLILTVQVSSMITTFKGSSKHFGYHNWFQIFLLWPDDMIQNGSQDLKILVTSGIKEHAKMRNSLHKLWAISPAALLQRG